MLSLIQSARDVGLSSSCALPYACAQAATGRCLQQQMFILTALEAEPQDPGVSRGGSLWGLSPCLADGRRLPVSSHGRPCVRARVLISSYKDPVLLDEGLPQWPPLTSISS